MKNLYRFHVRLIPLVLSIFAMGFVAKAQAIEGDAAAGEKLFKTYCASCHKLDSKAIGPALGGVTERREAAWLHSWITNNASFRASGDGDAKAIFDEFNGSVMPAFEYLAEADINNILAYTANPPAAPAPVAVAEGVASASNDDDSTLMLYLMVILGAVFIALIFILATVRNTLKVVKGEEPTSVVQDASAYVKFLRKNTGFMTVFTIVVGVAFLNVTYNYLMSVGVEQGYEPAHPETGKVAQVGEQPIAFSHKLHAGDNEIDCNYCHSSARHSKTSGIPSANVCMNCHMYVDGSEIVDAAGSKKYGGERSPEIQKIYNAVGWDPETLAYIEGYEEKPIRWVRIHNLPDLAYFNHAQHVSAGEIECQTCHGPVEEMEVMYQYSSLTMGWCINCHRETEVQVSTNGYYEPQHDKLVEKYHGEEITVEKIGGLECGKCHY